MAYKRLYTFDPDRGLTPRIVTPTEARREKKLLEDAKISNWQLAILYAINALGSATLSEIGFFLAMDRPVVAKNMRRLKELRAVLEAMNNRRDSAVELSELGRKFLAEGLQLCATITEQIRS